MINEVFIATFLLMHHFYNRSKLNQPPEIIYVFCGSVFFLH